MLLLLPRKCWNRLVCWYSKSRNQIVSLNRRGSHLSSCLPKLFIAHSFLPLPYVMWRTLQKAVQSERDTYSVPNARHIRRCIGSPWQPLASFAYYETGVPGPFGTMSLMEQEKKKRLVGANLQRSVRVLCWAPSLCNFWLLRTDLSRQNVSQEAHIISCFARDAHFNCSLSHIGICCDLFQYQ